MKHYARMRHYDPGQPRLSMEDREGRQRRRFRHRRRPFHGGVQLARRTPRGFGRGGCHSRHQLQAEDISEGREMDTYWASWGGGFLGYMVVESKERSGGGWYRPNNK
ncbi:hypothetical protein C8R46DRAFT_1197452 [Mycena filopes]|nr:hypothetical protein C8R46DRAFT_1197452 [Mycena filopes]